MSECGLIVSRGLSCRSLPVIAYHLFDVRDTRRDFEARTWATAEPTDRPSPDQLQIISNGQGRDKESQKRTSFPAPQSEHCRSRRPRERC